MFTKCIYGLLEPPTTVEAGEGNDDVLAGTVVPTKHSFKEMPKRGDRVVVGVNTLGPGTVSSYFVEHGYVGVAVKLDTATEPEWHKKQCKGTKYEGYALVFGAELK